jgi:hypothetical protein
MFAFAFVPAEASASFSQYVHFVHTHTHFSYKFQSCVHPSHTNITFTQQATSSGVFVKNLTAPSHLQTCYCACRLPSNSEANAWCIAQVPLLAAGCFLIQCPQTHVRPHLHLFYINAPPPHPSQTPFHVACNLICHGSPLHPAKCCC